MTNGFFHLPDYARDRVSVFTANTTTTFASSPPNGAKVWHKPRNTSLYVHFLVLGGGGGGGGGVSGASGSRSGGGGGGASGILSLIMPAFAVPDLLYVAVGYGGAGGTPASSLANSGSAGIESSVSSTPWPSSSAAAHTMALVTGGNAGTGGGTGTGGFAGSVGTVSTGGLGLIGVKSSPTPVGSSAGGGTSSSAGLVFATSLAYVTGGVGGAGTGGASDNAAGAMTVGIAGFEPLIADIPGGAANGGRGSDGVISLFRSMAPTYFTGGTGGGSAFGGTAGDGGKGGYGCGGGGGGGGVTGGNGGRGGDGLVIITAL
jgi:hypothetical protein